MSQVEIDSGRVSLLGELRVPPDAVGITVFAHGSGSTRLSPRNVAVARALNERGIATLLFDLLTPAEANDRGNVFDIDLLSDRLEAATRWAATGRARRLNRSPPRRSSSSGAKTPWSWR